MKYFLVFHICLIYILINIDCAISQDFSVPKDKYIFLTDSTDKYSQLGDLLVLPYFKDKVVLIDLWFTTCKPCIQEFSSLPGLKKEFKDQSLAYLYVCVPVTLKWNSDREKTWREYVVKYDLEGVNVKLGGDNPITENFWQGNTDHYTEDRSYGYPTYLLVNKKGDIVDYDAPRPSQGEELYSKIRALILE